VPSAAGVLAFLSWGSVPPPLTFGGASKCWRPAHGGDGGRTAATKRGAFADTRDAYRMDGREAQPQAAFREVVSHAVRDTVRAHLVADVPVGVFLSGGIDSSAIVSARARSARPSLRTFTVAFDDLSSERSGLRGRWPRPSARRHHELRLEATARRSTTCRHPRASRSARQSTP